MNKLSSNHTKIISWAKTAMEKCGYDLQLTEEIIVDVPWSVVIRFSTKQGDIYLKQTPSSLFIEVAILTALRNECHVQHIPELIEINKELCCFLMKDAGRPLREILKQKFDATLFCKAIEQFTKIQLVVADHVNVFLDIGVPDWRLDKLPDLYKQLLSQKDILKEDGLSEIEIRKLWEMLPNVSDLCKKLSGYSIKQTIVQCDFHDNNILINDLSKSITNIDLGEIVISHPFFSLVGCLHQAKKHHALSDEDDAYLQLMDACLKNHQTFESKRHLLDAFEITHTLWFIYEALAQYRLSLACDKGRLKLFQRHGKLSCSLKGFMTACIAIKES